MSLFTKFRKKVDFSFSPLRQPVNTVTLPATGGFDSITLIRVKPTTDMVNAIKKIIKECAIDVHLTLLPDTITAWTDDRKKERVIYFSGSDDPCDYLAHRLSMFGSSETFGTLRAQIYTLAKKYFTPIWKAENAIQTVLQQGNPDEYK